MLIADGVPSSILENSHDSMETNEGTYFGMKEYCESIKWTHQFPLVRQDDAFEKMALRTSRYCGLKQKNRKNNLKTAASEFLVAMTHDDNCGKDFFQFRHFKSSRTLVVSVSQFFFFVNGSC